MKKKIYKRNCPKCDKVILHSNKRYCIQAERDGRKCHKCAFTGRKMPDTMCKNQSERMKRNNPMFVKEYREKVRESKLNTPTEVKNKISSTLRKLYANPENHPFYGKHHSDDTKRVLRIKASKRMKELGVYPAYNPEACGKIEEYGKEHGYNFQHAENGGEYHIKELGYWVDGYDKEKNVVIEYMENHHNRTSQIKKDKKRKEEIVEFLNCKFIEMGE
jgi:hypothetical protein